MSAQDEFIKLDIHSGRPTNIRRDVNTAALYHVVRKSEDFVTAAQHLFSIVKMSQDNYPNKTRVLYLDIEGHREADGFWDWDMAELQGNFLLGFLSPYLSEMYLPLMHVKNTQDQDNAVPEKLTVGPASD